MKRGNIRFCKLCETTIKTIKEIFGSKSKTTKSKQIITSQEGVYFEDGKVWFCNDCWKLVNGEFK